MRPYYPELETHKRHWWRVALFVLLAVLAALIAMIFLQMRQIAKEQTKGAALPAAPAVNYVGEQQQLIEGQDAYWAGQADAALVIVEFSDFVCPFCKQAWPIIRQFSLQNAGQLKYIYRHRPAFQYSIELALASECAGEQGKFWEMHDKLFLYQSADLGANLADLVALSQQINLDTEQFSQCLTSKKYLSKVRQDFVDSQTLGVTGTPTWFINGEKVEGVISEEEWEKLLQM